MSLSDSAARLLQRWCNQLLTYQLTGPVDLAGAILCPACQRCHGRSLDLVYPLVSLYVQHQDRTYLAAAERLLQWGEHHLRAPEGGWVNDKHIHLWPGTTVFAAVGLAEALYHHREALGDEPFVAELEASLAYATDFILNTFTPTYGNINYAAAAAYFFELVGQQQERLDLIHKARYFAEYVLAHLTPEGLLYGEGNPREKPSARGCYPIDLGYNVEVSLPMLVLYAQIGAYHELKPLLKTALDGHQRFLLADGAWDNSWGTRHYKWSYWGTRTGDGAQIAYALMGDQDPAYLAVAQANLDLWETLSPQDVLTSFPHAPVMPCLEHALTHAKGLARLVDFAPVLPSTDDTTELKLAPLPIITALSDLQTCLVQVGPWRATLTAYDYEYAPFSWTHAMGGSLTLLHHTQLGPLIAGSLTEYQQIEKTNMVMPFASVTPPITPHWRYQAPTGELYLNLNDPQGRIEAAIAGEKAQILTHNRLFNRKGELCPQAPGPIEMRYRFESEALHIQGQVAIAPEGLIYVLPLILAADREYERISLQELCLHTPGGWLRVQASQPLDILPAPRGQRLFHPVPGFFALPIALRIQSAEPRFIVRLSLWEP